MATELATGYLSVVPEAKGFGTNLVRGVGPQMTAAGGSISGMFSSSFTKGLGGLASGPALLGGAIAGMTIAASKALRDLGVEFDKAYDTIRVGTGATGQALEGLKDDFRAVVTSVPASFEDASEAIASVNSRLGLTGKELQEVSEQFLELSRLTKSDLTQNIEGITRLFGDWGVATGDMSDAMDLLFVVGQKTGVSMATLSRNMVMYGAPLRQFGFEMRDAAAMLGKFEQEGVNTELVMGSLRIALGKLSRAGVSDTKGALLDVMEAIKAAGSAGEANAIAFELFGARAGADMAAAIREGRFELEALIDFLDQSEETITGVADQTRSALEQAEIEKGRFKIVWEPVAEQLYILEASAVAAAGGIVAFATGQDYANVSLEQAGPTFKDAASAAWGYATTAGGAASASSDLMMRSGELSPKLGGVAGAADGAAGAMEGATGAATDMARALDGGYVPAESLDAALRELKDITLEHESAALRVISAQERYDQTLKDGSSTSTDAKRAHNDLEKAILAEKDVAADLAKVEQDVADKQAALNTIQEKTVDKQEPLIQSVYTLRTKYDELGDSIANLPKWSPPSWLTGGKQPPQEHQGGVLSGPASGYPVVMHDTEAFVNLSDPGAPGNKVALAAIDKTFGGGDMTLVVNLDLGGEVVRAVHRVTVEDMRDGFVEFDVGG